jgi:hypothetical protein
MAWAGQIGFMRVVVTHVWGNGTVVTRAVDVGEDSGGVRWGDLAARALADPPPYRPVPGGAVCQVKVDGQEIMVAERDLAGPLLDLVAAVLDQGDVVSRSDGKPVRSDGI